MTLLQIAQRNIRQHLSKASFGLEVDRLAANNCLDVMDAALAALETEVSQLRAKVGEYDLFRKEAAKLADDYISLNATCAGAIAERDQLRAQLAALETEVVGLNQRNANLQFMLGEVCAERDQLRKEIADRDARIATLETAMQRQSNAVKMLDMSQVARAETMMQHAQVLHDLSKPDELESLRQANAILTGDLERTEAELARLRGQDFQSRIAAWMQTCFGPEISADKVERDLRFLEEALELVQANGTTRETACNVLDYVFGRPVGETSQEVGGVMVTLAALCLAHGISLQECADTEAARIEGKIEQIRAKQAAKPRLCFEPTPAKESK